MADYKILTVSELAEHLNIHRITVYRLLKNGTLPGFKIGRVWRFDQEEITAWIQTGKGPRSASSALPAAEGAEHASTPRSQSGTGPKRASGRAHV